MSDDEGFVVLDGDGNDAEQFRIVVFGPTRFKRSLVLLVMTEAADRFWADRKYYQQRWVVAELLDDQANPVTSQGGSSSLGGEDGARTDTVHFAPLEPDVDLSHATCTIFFPHLRRRFAVDVRPPGDPEQGSARRWREIAN